MNKAVEKFLSAKDNEQRRELLRSMNPKEVTELLDLIAEVDKLLEEVYGYSIKKTRQYVG